MSKTITTPAAKTDPSSSKRRYVVVGTGGRSWMFIQALVATYRDGCELVAFCDTNHTRMNFYNRAITATFGFPPVRTYPAKDFDRMIRGAQPDAVIVATIDAPITSTSSRRWNLPSTLNCEKSLQRIVLPGTVADAGYSVPTAKDPIVPFPQCCGLD
jgi:threonine dehydrogenase-like Zn-dependent dehydrogenase